MTDGDPAEWVRTQCLRLARSNGTPVGYWLSLPLGELVLWIRTHNRIADADIRAREKARKKR